MFESRHQPLLPSPAFIRRMLLHFAVAIGIIAFGLGLGVLGYRRFESMSWLDATLNASMILGGMGPVNELHTRAGKIFASCYAIFSGVIFLVAVGALFSPVVHRIAHSFHLPAERGDIS